MSCHAQSTARCEGEREHRMQKTNNFMSFSFHHMTWRECSTHPTTTTTRHQHYLTTRTGKWHPQNVTLGWCDVMCLSVGRVVLLLLVFVWCWCCCSFASLLLFYFMCCVVLCVPCCVVYECRSIVSSTWLSWFVLSSHVCSTISNEWTICIFS